MKWYNNSVMSGVLVSIVCTNYNKGRWIRDAIDSFLMQKTDFDYEIILIDDKSTDESPDIIKEYALKYPDKIRVFYNKKNLGITKTWKKVCKEARGMYIARCDGDDYWIDEYKLQKQYDALRRNKSSKWCCTDYDVIDEYGKIVRKSAVESGYIKRPDSYAEMLATKGFTMSSTWLIETKLLLEVNDELDDRAVDDTFNIQLDLFSKTKLTYLSEPMVMYRVNQGSDSKPADLESIKKRDMRLLETQLQYIEKYKNKEYKEIITLLLKSSIESDDRLRLIERQRALIESQEKMIADQVEAIKHLNEDIVALIASKRYRVGRFILMPLTIVKAIVKRRSR